MSATAVRVEGLTKLFKERSRTPVRALDGLSLHVHRGEIFGLLGPNGAGKTTLVRILATLITPTSGSASVLGWDVQAHPLEVRRRICVVLQENAIELYLSVRDNLITFSRFHSVPPPEVKRRVQQVVEQFGLQQYLFQKVIDLSGGLKRRVQVAKVFMVDKPVVFLDEATTGMDPINKRATIDAIREQARQGRTIVLTTHILEEAEELCDSVAIIHHGRELASGDVRTIKSLASKVFDISLTFERCTEVTIQALQALPLLDLMIDNNVATLRVRGEGVVALELLAKVLREHKVLHFEVNSASLEDAFLELLGGALSRPSSRSVEHGEQP